MAVWYYRNADAAWRTAARQMPASLNIGDNLPVWNFPASHMKPFFVQEIPVTDFLHRGKRSFLSCSPFFRKKRQLTHSEQGYTHFPAGKIFPLPSRKTNPIFRKKFRIQRDKDTSSFSGKRRKRRKTQLPVQPILIHSADISICNRFFSCYFIFDGRVSAMPHSDLTLN